MARPPLPVQHDPSCNLRRYHESGQARFLNAWRINEEPCLRCRALWRLLDEAEERRIQQAAEVA